MAGGANKPVSPLVAEQIAARKKVIEKKVGRTNDDLLYLNAKTGWIKLSSSVNTLTPGEIAQLRAGVDPAIIQGSNKLAEYNILLGGLLRPDRGLREGIDVTGGYNESAAYNNRKGSTGIRPMPGITSMNVKSKNTYGTLRVAEVKLMCWTLEDFEMIEQLYLRPGYTVLLEWGHSMYIDNSGVLHNDIQTIGNRYFQQGITMSQLTKEIKQIRTVTHNNYEGMIGYIENFSWSYTADGAYDCSVSIISTGEILESIQMRFDPAQRGANLDDPSTEKGKEQSKSIYHNFIVQISEIVDKPSFNINTIREAIKPLGDGLLEEHLMYYQDVQIDNYFIDDDTPMHWMSLRLYLDIFNTLISPIDTTKPKGTPDRSVVKFNTDLTKSSKFLTSPEHFSIDPATCVLVKKAELETGETIEVTAPQKGAAPAGDADDVLNIYISLPYLKTVLDGALDKDGKLDKSMHDITGTILEGINTALGGINDLDLAYDEEDEGGTWYIIDRNNTPPDSQEAPEFTLAGIQSVFTDVGISSKISNEVGSQISIAAQGSASGTNEYIENILRWNTGIVDRIKVVKTTVDKAEKAATAAAAAQTASDAKKELEKRTATWIKEVVTVFNEFNTTDGYDKDDMQAIKTMHAEWTVANVVTKYRIQNKAAIPGLVPVELSLKLDGIGGFIIGQVFRIAAGILPSKYQDKFGYLITGLEHTIDSTNSWETSITTQFYSIEKPTDAEVQAAGQPPGVSTREAANQQANDSRKAVNASTTKGGTSRVLGGVTYKNGQIPDDKLRYLANWKKYVGANQSDGGRLRMYVDASIAADRLIAAAEANTESGRPAPIKFKVNSCYRTLEDQQRVKNQYGDKAATPGRSNHGFGLAVDFSVPGSLKTIPVSSIQYKWLQENAAKYGFKRLPYSPNNPESWEAWHWEYQI